MMCTSAWLRKSLQPSTDQAVYTTPYMFHVPGDKNMVTVDYIMYYCLIKDTAWCREGVKYDIMDHQLQRYISNQFNTVNNALLIVYK